MTAERSPMVCVNCGGDCVVRPVGMEAICWECWFRDTGVHLVLNAWKKRPWWKRRGARCLRWDGPLNFKKGNLV